MLSFNGTKVVINPLNHEELEKLCKMTPEKMKSLF
jgi:hypothetical protein